jgi:hypothetical protein
MQPPGHRRPRDTSSRPPARGRGHPTGRGGDRAGRLRHGAGPLRPLLPLRILASCNRGGAYASIALAMFAHYGAFLFLTYILQGIEHLSPLATGLGFLPLTEINGLASTQVASRLLARIPVRPSWSPGC